MVIGLWDGRLWENSGMGSRSLRLGIGWWGRVWWLNVAAWLATTRNSDFDVALKLAADVSGARRREVEVRPFATRERVAAAAAVEIR